MPGLGRFTSRDPHPYNLHNPFELNRYVYTANNPVMFSDPSGQIAEAISANSLSRQSRPALAAFGKTVAHMYRRILWLFLGGTAGGAIGIGATEAEKQLKMLLDEVNNPKIDPPETPEPDPEVDPKLDPERIPPFPRTGTQDDNNKVVVELGAGNYKNAIANKIKNPRWNLWGTNKHNDRYTTILEDMENGGPPSILDEINEIFKGFHMAKSMGIKVGASSDKPLTNEDMTPNFADLVYVIAPWPGNEDHGPGILLDYGMGLAAGKIAKSESGTEIYIAASGPGLTEFRRGVSDAGHSCNWQPDYYLRFGVGYYEQPTTAETCIVP